MASSRRGNGEGSVFELPSGGWRGFITLGYDANGKQVKKWVYGPTRQAAAQKLNAIAAKAGTRLVNRPEKVTVAQWLEKYVQLRTDAVRPRTLDMYRRYAARINAKLGRIQLQRLTPLMIQEFYADLAEEGLSPSSRQHMHHFLKAAVRQALKLELIERSPFEVIDAPKGGRLITPRVWDADQIRTFLATARNERLYAAFYLMLTVGARVGETLALKWGDLDEDRLHIARTVTFIDYKPVFGPPKTSRGDRILFLSEDVLEVLAERRELQAMERAIAPSWSDEDLIFTTATGNVIDPHNLRRSFKRLIEVAKVPKMRVHDMRHTYITFARDAGLDAEVVAHRVGQDVRVTMQIYSKVTEARKRKAAKTLKELLNDSD